MCTNAVFVDRNGSTVKCSHAVFGTHVSNNVQLFISNECEESDCKNSNNNIC